MLVAENISKKIDNKSILDNVSIKLLPSQVTAIIGPNGAGKSTLLRALALVDLPSLGKIQIDDAVYNFPNSQITTPPWPKLTVVFQQHFLWPHLTIRENIILPAKENNTEKFKEKFEELVTALNLAEFIDRYPNQISGGQRQRSALARAIILRPKYLLLDEITASLDIEQIKEIIEYIPKLKAEGVSILIISHLIGLVKKLADNVVFIEEGQILEEGSPDQVLNNPKNLRLKSFLDYSL